MLYVNLGDAIKEGDPFRLNVTLKGMLPLFFVHSRLSKYAVEIVDYILKTEVMLTPRLAMRVRLGSFVNTRGGKGENKPADMQQENNVRMTKDVIKGLGAQKTEKSMGRATAAAPLIAATTAHYQELLGVHIRHRGHTHRSRGEDITELLTHFSNIKPFVETPGRSLKGFPVNANPVHYLNFTDFESFVKRTVQRLARGVNV